MIIRKIQAVNIKKNIIKNVALKNILATFFYYLYNLFNALNIALNDATVILLLTPTPKVSLPLSFLFI